MDATKGSMVLEAPGFPGLLLFVCVSRAMCEECRSSQNLPTYRSGKDPSLPTPQTRSNETEDLEDV